LARVKGCNEGGVDIKPPKKREYILPIKFEGLQIVYKKRRKVVVKDQKIDLSPKKFELLVLMASNSREEIIQNRNS